jgi:uncharacterized protein YbaP (TraB family)
MAALLLAAAIAASLPATQPAIPLESEPAIFVVRDADTTIYIFGTFHALDARTAWFKDAVRDAFERSDELVLETLVPEGPPSPVSIPQPQSLRSMTVTTSASFLATTRLAINAGRSQGMQVDNGADMVLRRTAEAEGKTVEGLETLQSQLTMFNRLPPPPPGSVPQESRGGTGGAPAMNSLSQSMAEMQSAWKRGDQTVFVRILGQLEQGSPETYRMMFTERNARWADWIRARLRTPGTVFVAVGAGHLAGKDSVLVQLAQRGVPSQRVY